jgi:hypothetical protein
VGGLMHFRWLLKSSFSAAFLLMAVWAARSDGVPVLDLNPICRGIAQCGRRRTRLARLVCSLH